MKYSKSAMRKNHVELGHMTMMKPTAFAEPEVATAPARVYSTERYSPVPTNNGLTLPQALRDRIERSFERPEEDGQTSISAFLSTGWGFL